MALQASEFQRRNAPLPGDHLCLAELGPHSHLITLCRIFLSSWSRHTAKGQQLEPMICTLSTLMEDVLIWKGSPSSGTGALAIVCQPWCFFPYRNWESLGQDCLAVLES